MQQALVMCTCCTKRSTLYQSTAGFSKQSDATTPHLQQFPAMFL